MEIVKNTIIKIKEGYTIIEYDKSNIYIIENILEHDFCDKVINIINTVPLYKTHIEQTYNVECFTSSIYELLATYEDYYDLSNISNNDYLSNNNTIHTINSLNGITKTDLEKLDNYLSEKIKIIRRIMSEINSEICFDYNTGYNLRKIYGETRTHIDSIITIMKSDATFIDKTCIIENCNMIRNSTMIFALNDDYNGGVFNFPYHNIYLKLKKGSVIIFPPYWTHPHQVSSVENNTYRYTINTWTLELLK